MEPYLDSVTFSRIRHDLGGTQVQLAQLLGVSPKAIQSFEQGWRAVPMHAERQLLFLLYLKKSSGRNLIPCWERKSCPPEQRQNCPAWKFQAGHLCWFITGTICEGKAQKNWQKKMELCRQCEVFRSLLSIN